MFYDVLRILMRRALSNFTKEPLTHLPRSPRGLRQWRSSAGTCCGKLAPELPLPKEGAEQVSWTPWRSPAIDVPVATEVAHTFEESRCRELALPSLKSLSVLSSRYVTVIFPTRMRFHLKRGREPLQLPHEAFRVLEMLWGPEASGPGKPAGGQRPEVPGQRTVLHQFW